MKLKTALAVSIGVNVVVLTALGYMNTLSVNPPSTPPIVIYMTNGPSAVEVIQELAQR